MSGTYLRALKFDLAHDASSPVAGDVLLQMAQASCAPGKSRQDDKDLCFTVGNIRRPFRLASNTLATMDDVGSAEFARLL